MKRFDLYGSCTMSVEGAARLLESHLDEQFKEHESGYGGVYFRLASEGEEQACADVGLDRLRNEAF